MVSLSSIKKGCKDSLGGLKLVYIFTFKKYARSQIITDDNILTSFPETVIYPYIFTGSPSFDNKSNEEDGGKYYSENITLNFSTLGNSFDLFKLLKQDLRMIFKDNNGKYRILGLYNGLTCTSVKADSGSSKNTFNGYTVSLEGEEETQSLYVDSLQDAGFIINEEDVFNRITEDNFDRITENNNTRIVQ